jgi:hypothetical protein
VHWHTEAVVPCEYITGGVALPTQHSGRGSQIFMKHKTRARVCSISKSNDLTVDACYHLGAARNIWRKTVSDGWCLSSTIFYGSAYFLVSAAKLTIEYPTHPICSASLSTGHCTDAVH